MLEDASLAAGPCFFCCCRHFFHFYRHCRHFQIHSTFSDDQQPSASFRFGSAGRRGKGKTRIRFGFKPQQNESHPSSKIRPCLFPVKFFFTAKCSMGCIKVLFELGFCHRRSRWSGSRLYMGTSV